MQSVSRRLLTSTLFLFVGIWTTILIGLGLWERHEPTTRPESSALHSANTGSHFLGGTLLEGTLGLGSIGCIAGLLLWFRRMDQAREQTLSALRKSEQDLASVLDSIEDIVFSLDATGRIQAASKLSDKWLRIGCARPCIGACYADVLSSDTVMAVRAALELLTTTGKTQEIDYTTESKGQLIYWNGTVTCRRHADRAGSGALVVIRDVTRRGKAATALRDNEERWRLIYERTCEGIVLSRLDGTYVSANPAACTILGMSERELLVKGRTLVAEPSRAAFERLVEQRDKNGVARGELQLRRADGTLADLEGSSSLFRLSNGETRIVTIVHDITTRKHAERAAQENALRWQTALEAAGDGLWEWNLETDDAYFSPTGTRILGLEPDEVSPRMDEWRKRVHPDDLAPTMVLLEQHLAGRTETYQTEHRLRCKDGTYKWILVRGRVITRASDGRPQRMVGTHKDLSGIRQAEQNLRASEERYRRLLNSTTDYVFTVTLTNGQLTGVTRTDGCLSVTGYTAEEYASNPQLWFEVIAPADQPAVRAHWEAALQSNAGKPIEYRIAHKNGSNRWVRGTLVARHDPPGRLVAIDGLVQDISERKEVEVALRESEEKFHQAFHHAPLLMVVTNLADGRILEANALARKVSGYNPQTDLGRSAVDLGWFTEADRKRLVGLLQTQGFVTDAELVGRKQNGTSIHCLVNCQLVVIAGETRVITTLQDISARKRVEAELHESHANYLGLFNTVSEAIYVQDVDGVFLDVNEGATRMYGCSREELVGQTLATVAAVGRNDLAAIASLLLGVVATGTPAVFEFWAHRKSGEEFPKACVSSRGKYFGRDVIITTARDITEWKRAEATLRESEHMLRESQIVAALGSYVLDIEADAWLSSAVLDGILGIDASFARSTPSWTSLIAPTDRPAMADYFTREVIGKGSEFDRQYRIVRLNDGVERWVHGLGKLEFDASGRPVRMLGTIQDITDRKRAEMALRESEERYRMLVELSPEAVFVHNRGQILFANRAAVRLTGAGSPDQVIGTNVLNFVHPESRAVVEQRVNDNGPVGQVLPAMRQKWLRLNGELIELSVVATRIMFNGVPASLVLAMDMTAQRLAEAELRKLSRAVEQSPVTVVITDAAGRIEYVNPSFTTKTGYTMAEVRGQATRVLRSGETPQDYYRDLWLTITAGREWRGEFHNRKKNGELFWEAATISPIFGEDGHITHFLAVKEDITEQKAAADRIREQAALLDITQDAVLVLSLDRRVTFWNHAAEKLYGLTSPEAMGRPYESIAYRDPPTNDYAEWQQLLEKGCWSIERRQFARGRGEIVVQMQATLVRDERGSAKSVLLVVTDITEAKHLEAQFLRAQRLESLGSLASGVAHDLNNVLTPILMSTGMLADGARTTSERELIQLLSDSARRGADIVQQLLLYGRGSDTPRAAMSVAAVIKDMEQMMRGSFPKNIAITTRVPRDLWSIKGDRTQIHQVILNFCVNSRDAMPSGGRLSALAENIHVDAEFAKRHPGAEPGPHVAVRVCDTGTGIPAELLDKIFDPFFTTKPIGKGTGLGLATVLGIVRSHRGFVTVESQKGIGTEFRVYLPAEASAGKLVGANAHRKRFHSHGELILVIDDEANIRRALVSMLRAQHYEVMVACDGAEGIAAFGQQAKTIRLVITDMMMPVMDGTQAIRALRQVNPDLPVIAMSGLPAQRSELEATFGPRFRFLPKPFLIEQALALVDELLCEPSPSPSGDPTAPK